MSSRRTFAFLPSTIALIVIALLGSSGGIAASMTRVARFQLTPSRLVVSRSPSPSQCISQIRRSVLSAQRRPCSTERAHSW